MKPWLSSPLYGSAGGRFHPCGNVLDLAIYQLERTQTYVSLAAAKTAGAPVIAYGQLINKVINFMVISFVIFMIVKQATGSKADARADTGSHQRLPSLHEQHSDEGSPLTLGNLRSE